MEDIDANAPAVEEEAGENPTAPEGAQSEFTAPAPTAGDAAPLAAPSFHEIVERWWADHFPGSPVGLVTQAWNHAFAAKEDLKRRLAAL